MAEPNAFFCVLKSDGEGVAPREEAVKEHNGVGALWLRPGTPFPQAVKSIQEYAQLPPESEFSYLLFWHGSGVWVKVRDVHAAKRVEPGVTYCFKVLPPQYARAGTSAKRQKTESPDALKKLPLHQIFDYPSFFNVPTAAFGSFMFKRSTRDLCKQMVSSLAEICSCQDDERRDVLCREFRDVYSIAVHCGKEWWKILPSPAGVLLDQSTFFSVMIIKPGSDAYIQSGGFLLDDQADVCLKELGLLHWISQLLRIKPEVEAGQRLTLGSGEYAKQVQVVEELNASSPVSNSVLRVSCGSMEMVMKMGHSAEATRLIQHLCLPAVDQVVNEAKVLQKLQGCKSLPPLAFAGQWEDKAVVLTELQGSCVEEAIPYGSRMEDVYAERLCKDLTSIVMELHDRGIAHGDIHPKNVGICTGLQERGGRLFYLYDFGCRVELHEGRGTPVAWNPKS